MWNHFVFHSHADDNEQWREFIKLPYMLFTCVCNLVCEDLEQGQIPARFSLMPCNPFNVEKKADIVIMLLDVAKTFGCGRSTVSNFMLDFVEALAYI